MKISFEPVDLHTKHTFKIAREGGGDVFHNVIVKLEHDGFTGYGEAAPFFIYGETQAITLAALESFFPLIEKWEEPWQAERMMNELDSVLERNYAAKAAVDMALYDLQGKLCGKPLYSLLGLDPHDVPFSTFTIGIDSPEVVREKVREVCDFPLLKIKVGGPQDLECLKVVHEEAPDALIRVDANCGWEPHEALNMIDDLVALGVEFVEQPLPPNNVEGMRWLHERSPLPLMADESCERLEDIAACAAGGFDAINIKLSKCGGIRHALKMIHCARGLGLKVMLGCMLETSVCITAAAQISPLVDYADLDGAVLIADDPFSGMEFDRCRMTLPKGPGLGVKPIG
ncbi:MAG: dipeptide epimerase [Gemmatimonadota bacterium]|nr:dipeptide epimerase [Gemmatimonadota bacterium]